MAYITKDLNLVAPNVGAGQGGSVWSYVNSDDDTAITIRGASFFSDGAAKGMKVGDLVISTAGAVGEVYRVSALSGDAATVT